MTRTAQRSASQTSTTGELSLNEIAEKVIPSVVCVQNYQKTGTVGYYFGSRGWGRGGRPGGRLRHYRHRRRLAIITNAHVVDGADSLKVVLYDGSTYEATLVGSDSVTDLAVIKIEATNLVPATFGSSEDLKVADQVMAIGNPGGLQFSSSVTVGYVSALNRTITTEDGYTIECIQTDAAINPGNSGGALVNKYGQVVGINSSKIAATGYEGLGFAIPIDTRAVGYFQPEGVRLCQGSRCARHHRPVRRQHDGPFLRLSVGRHVCCQRHEPLCFAGRYHAGLHDHQD
ncbi:MAG: S1C family serine protease [Oscillospiraceae bacterium]